MRTLTAIRKNIAQVQANLDTVNAALPPKTEFVESLRFQLNLALEKFDRTLDAAALAVANSESVELFASYHVEDRLDIALGAAIKAYGLENVLNDLLEKADKVANPSVLRMTLADKNKELTELNVALYTLEIEEEAALNGEVRREEMHPAAVLGIPLSILQAHPKYSFAAS